MSLWHMDWKQLKDGGWIIAIMDDASRLIVAYGVYPNATTDHAIQTLKAVTEKYGKPDESLTDKETQFYASEGERREKGTSRFEAFLEEQEVRHILARVNHPQTNGKLERWYGVLEDKIWRRRDFQTIEEYVHWHNEIKPHLSLNFEELETPIQAFHRKLPEERRLKGLVETKVN